MKKLLYSLAFVCLVGNILAQAPQKFSYQAAVRNSSNQLVSNGSVGVKISIVQTSETGSVVYQELFNPNPVTNANGLVTLQVGGGIPLIGTFAGINWANGPYYIKSEFDPTGGTNYTVSGTTQLLSVPYALFAGGSTNNSLPVGANQGDILYWNGTSWVVLAVGTERQELTICNGQLKWAPYLPSVTTSSPVSSITQSTAIVSGNVTNDGCGSVTRGICYSTSPNPTIANTVVNSGQGTGSFQATLSNLTTATTYYVKTFATNGAGTVYGNQQVFTTSNFSSAQIVLDTVKLINYNDFELLIVGLFNVISNGGSPITSIGLCYDTLPNPTLLNNYTNDTIQNFIFGKTYYVRAYATNLSGTSYSNTLTINPLLPYFIFNGITTYVQPFHYYINKNWGPTGNFTNANSLSNGQTNTLQIIANQGMYNSGSYAAKYCNDIIQFGFDDWYLPSKDELTQMGLGIVGISDINNINNIYYWSSTEFSNNNAWAKILSPNTTITNIVKTTENYIRCVRN
jgi:hypothetical protein